MTLLRSERGAIDLLKLVLVILILGFIGVLPLWPHAQSWGYWPGGLLGFLLLIVLLKVLDVI